MKTEVLTQTEVQLLFTGTDQRGPSSALAQYPGTFGVLPFSRQSPLLGSLESATRCAGRVDTKLNYLFRAETVNQCCVLDMTQRRAAYTETNGLSAPPQPGPAACE